jgi:hypothetical protein
MDSTCCSATWQASPCRSWCVVLPANCMSGVLTTRDRVGHLLLLLLPLSRPHPSPLRPVPNLRLWTRRRVGRRREERGGAATVCSTTRRLARPTRSTTHHPALVFRDLQVPGLWRKSACVCLLAGRNFVTSSSPGRVQGARWPILRPRPRPRPPPGPPPHPPPSLVRGGLLALRFLGGTSPHRLSKTNCMVYPLRPPPRPRPPPPLPPLPPPPLPLRTRNTEPCVA